MLLRAIQVRNASMRILRLSLLSFSVATALLFCGGAASQEPTTRTVVIKQLRFNPSDLPIPTGATVEWRNEDIFAHSVTADDGSFDSGLIPPGKSWKTTFNNSGKFTYHCRPHPNMTGGVRVASGTRAAHEIAGQTASGTNTEPGSLKWIPPTRPQEIHPILVNFTAALVPLALLSDVLGRVLRRQSLHNTACWMMVYAAVITPFTVVAGWWWKHAASQAIPPNLLTVHQWLGTSAAMLLIVLAFWRWKIEQSGIPPKAAYFTSAGGLVMALVYQGSIGGAMLFGR